MAGNELLLRLRPRGPSQVESTGETDIGCHAQVCFCACFFVVPHRHKNVSARPTRHFRCVGTLVIILTNRSPKIKCRVGPVPPIRSDRAWVTARPALFLYPAATCHCPVGGGVFTVHRVGARIVCKPPETFQAIAPYNLMCPSVVFLQHRGGDLLKRHNTCKQLILNDLS